MIEVPAYMPVVWFIAGFLAAIVIGGIIAHKHTPKALTRKQRTWTAIQNLTWILNFELTFRKNIGANELGKWIAIQMHEELKTKPLPAIEIKPGEYTVNLEVRGRFVKRTDDEQDPRSAGPDELHDPQR